MYVIVLAGMLVIASCGGSSKPAEPKTPGKVVVVDTEVEILDRIEFVPGGADIAPSSTQILDAVAKTLTNDPAIKLVEVAVHGDDKGLAETRANTIRDQLIARGVAPERLRASAGPEAKERVDFVILERAEVQ